MIYLCLHTRGATRQLAGPLSQRRDNIHTQQRLHSLIHKLAREHQQLSVQEFVICTQIPASVWCGAHTEQVACLLSIKLPCKVGEGGQPCRNRMSAVPAADPNGNQAASTVSHGVPSIHTREAEAGGSKLQTSGLFGEIPSQNKTKPCTMIITRT